MAKSNPPVGKFLSRLLKNAVFDRSNSAPSTLNPSSRKKPAPSVSRPESHKGPSVGPRKASTGGTSKSIAPRGRSLTLSQERAAADATKERNQNAAMLDSATQWLGGLLTAKDALANHPATLTALKTLSELREDAHLSPEERLQLLDLLSRLLASPEVPTEAEMEVEGEGEVASDRHVFTVPLKREIQKVHDQMKARFSDLLGKSVLEDVAHRLYNEGARKSLRHLSMANKAIGNEVASVLEQRHLGDVLDLIAQISPTGDQRVSTAESADRYPQALKQVETLSAVRRPDLASLALAQKSYGETLQGEYSNRSFATRALLNNVQRLGEYEKDLYEQTFPLVHQTKPEQLPFVASKLLSMYERVHTDEGLLAHYSRLKDVVFSVSPEFQPELIRQLLKKMKAIGEDTFPSQKQIVEACKARVDSVLDEAMSLAESERLASQRRKALTNALAYGMLLSPRDRKEAAVQRMIQRVRAEGADDQVKIFPQLVRDVSKALYDKDEWNISRAEEHAAERKARDDLDTTLLGCLTMCEAWPLKDRLTARAQCLPHLSAELGRDSLRTALNGIESEIFRSDAGASDEPLAALIPHLELLEKSSWEEGADEARAEKENAVLRCFRACKQLASEGTLRKSTLDGLVGQLSELSVEQFGEVLEIYEGMGPNASAIPSPDVIEDLLRRFIEDDDESVLPAAMTVLSEFLKKRPLDEHVFKVASTALFSMLQADMDPPGFLDQCMEFLEAVPAYGKRKAAKLVNSEFNDACFGLLSTVKHFVDMDMDWGEGKYSALADRLPKELARLFPMKAWAEEM